MVQDPSNWAEATAALIGHFTCPKCDAANVPGLPAESQRIRLFDQHGADCSCCGYGGELQMFLPPLMKETH